MTDDQIMEEMYRTLCEYPDGLEAKELAPLVGITVGHTNRLMKSMDGHGYLIYLEGGHSGKRATRYYAYDQVEPETGRGKPNRGVTQNGVEVRYGKWI